MSGIVGVWNLDGRPVETGLVREMCATLAHRGPDDEGVWIEGPVGLGCRLFRVTPESTGEIQPVTHPSGVALVFDGRLDNRDELLAALTEDSKVHEESPDPDLALAVYIAYGESLAERLKGDFSLGMFDSRKHRLLLVRDVVGVRPLFYCRADDTVLFASEIKAILKHPQVTAKPDNHFLARHLLGRSREETWHNTFFDGIYSLPPAHTVAFSRDSVSVRKYWDFSGSPAIKLGSFGEYAEAFREHFSRAVQRRLRSAYPVAVSVSGGLDSSSILCAAQSLSQQCPDSNSPIYGVTYDSPPGTSSDESAYLVEIERAYGISINRVPVLPQHPQPDFRKMVWHVESPFLDGMYGTMQAFYDRVRSLDVRVVLTGHWADQLLFDQAYLVDRFRRLAWGDVRRHLKEFERWFAEIDLPDYRRRFFIDLVKYSLPSPIIALVRSLRSKPGRPWFTRHLRRQASGQLLKKSLFRSYLPNAHSRALYEQIRSGHHVLCLEWDDKIAAMQGVEMSFPFLDRDLLSFLFKIPGEVVNWKGVPKALLREAMRPILPQAIRERNWKADFTYLVNEEAERNYHLLAQYLGPDAVAVREGYLSSETLMTELDRARTRLDGPECDIAWSLSDLLGLELWLRVFIRDYDSA